MNKTVNINLGGMFFHIDEDAYQKLSHYFDAIKRSLNNSNGQDEIIKDIEMRVAELFLQKNSTGRQVITLKEVDEVIIIMGQPEDYRLDNEESSNQETFHAEPIRTNKKLYRDMDNGVIGGVLSGLGHYFGVDKVWLRIFMLVLIFFFGTGILAYLVLWIIMPAAVTTSEKLEMTGKPVTISNIEKKVKESFDNVSNKIKNANYDHLGNQVKTGADKIAASAGTIFLTIFNIIAKIIGILLILGTLPVLAVLLIGIFTLNSAENFPFQFRDLYEASNYLDFPLWGVGLMSFFLIGIPVFYLMILGFKLLITKMKPLGNYVNYTLLAVWIMSISCLIYLSIAKETQTAAKGKIINKEVLPMQSNDTLNIQMIYNQKYSNSVQDHIGYEIVEGENNNKILYSDNVEFAFLKSNDKKVYLEISKESKSKSISNAKEIANKIIYEYAFDGKNLTLNDYLLTDSKQKIRNQKVSLTLYIPENVPFKFDENIIERNDSYDSLFSFNNDNSGEIYILQNNQLICLSCFQVGEELIIEEINQTSIDSTNHNKTTQSKGLTYDKDGKIIKI